MELTGSMPGSAGNNVAGTGAVGGSNSQEQVASNPITPAGGTSLLGQGNAAITVGNQTAASNNTLLNNNNAQLSSLDSLLKSIQAQEQANTPGVALTGSQLNLNGLQAQAQASAKNTVNPLYTQYLNEYNQSLAQNETAAQAENANNIAAEQNTLQNTLAQNTQAQLYAGQQNAATQGNINAEAQNYQLNSANANNAKIQTISGQLGSGNISASGYGQQQLWQNENARNVADAQQQGQFQYQRNTSNLSTQDTFAQLAQSSLYAQEGATTSENATNFNLSDYLRQAAQNDTQYTQSLTQNQQEAISATTQNDLAQALQSRINSANLSGKNLAATEQAYSPELTSVSIPGMLNQSDYLNGPNAETV